MHGRLSLEFQGFSVRMNPIFIKTENVTKELGDLQLITCFYKASATLSSKIDNQSNGMKHGRSDQLCGIKLGTAD